MELSAIQIESCLPKLQAMASRKRELIAQYQAKVDSGPPIKKQVKLIKSAAISPQQFSRFPVRFFWTREGKSARYYYAEFTKPCILCDSYARIEIVDKYSTVQLCELHGLQVAQKLELQVAELPVTTSSGTKKRAIMSNKRIDLIIAQLEKLRDQRIQDKIDKEDDDA